MLRLNMACLLKRCDCFQQSNFFMKFTLYANINKIQLIENKEIVVMSY